MLVAKEDHAILEQRGAQRIIGRPVERLREIDARDQRAQARLQRGDVEEGGGDTVVERLAVYLTVVVIARARA
jgi:hypothetical protein